MLALTLPYKTWAHRVPAPAKLVALSAFTIALFPQDNPVWLGAALGGVAGLYLTLGTSAARYGVRMLKPLWLMAAIIAGYHVLTADLVGGLNIVLRLLATVALANFITMTTRLDDMVAVVEGLLSPLAGFGLNPKLFGLAMAMVVRFTPVLIEKSGHLIESWRSRSRKRPNWRIVIPVCLSALDDADHVAEALRARGGVGPTRVRNKK